MSRARANNGVSSRDHVARRPNCVVSAGCQTYMGELHRWPRHSRLSPNQTPLPLPAMMTSAGLRYAHEAPRTAQAHLLPHFPMSWLVTRYGPSIMAVLFKVSDKKYELRLQLSGMDQVQGRWTWCSLPPLTHRRCLVHPASHHEPVP